MRKMKMLAGIVLSVITVFSSVGAVKAEEGTVTDRPKIKIDIETEVEERQISEEYFEALKQYLGWDYGTNGVSVQTSDTVSFTFDLEASGLTVSDINQVSIRIIPPCYTDSDGKIQVIPDDSLCIAHGHLQNDDDEELTQYIGGNGIYLNKKIPIL